MKVIFSVSDTEAGGGHLVEAAIDAFKVSEAEDILSNEDLTQTVDLKVYPNPASTNITFEMTQEHWHQYETMQLEIYNAMGQSIQSQLLTNPKTSISVDQFCKGIYFYQITSAAKVILDGKLLVH